MTKPDAPAPPPEAVEGLPDVPLDVEVAALALEDALVRASNGSRPWFREGFHDEFWWCLGFLARPSDRDATQEEVLTRIRAALPAEPPARDRVAVLEEIAREAQDLCNRLADLVWTDEPGGPWQDYCVHVEPVELRLHALFYALAGEAPAATEGGEHG